MSKDINLKSEEWNDIIFEGKNKDYGAYEMRKSSSKRHIIAFLISALILIFVSFLPMLIETVAQARNSTDNISESSYLADLKELEEQVQEKDIIREDAAPPPPPLKSTIQFTAPEIVSADEITDDDQMKSQDDLAATKIQISVATVEGTDELTGIDIADLQEHKVVAEEKDERIHEVVEQQASFPGGEAALSRFLYENIKYPAQAVQANIEGVVYLKFVVNKQGQISDIKVISSPSPLLDKEAIRVLKLGNMPKWNPARNNGKPVNAYFTLPVDFQFQ